MDNSIIFPLSVFPMPIRNIVDSLHKYENYQIDFTASAFLTVFAATMGNTWSARFMTGWVSRPIIYMVLVGPPSCGTIHAGRDGDAAAQVPCGGQLYHRSPYFCNA